MRCNALQLFQIERETRESSNDPQQLFNVWILADDSVSFGLTYSRPIWINTRMVVNPVRLNGTEYYAAEVKLSKWNIGTKTYFTTEEIGR